MTNRTERLKKLNADAYRVSMSHGDEALEVSPIDAKIMIMFGRMRSLFHAVNILVERDLPEEAVILGRELFTDSLRFAELARQDVQARAALVLGTDNQTLDQWEQMEQTAKSLDPAHRTPRAVTAEIAARRKNIQAGMQRFGVTKLGRFPNERELAKNNGRLDDFMDFQLSHRFVHRADMAQLSRTRKVEDRLGVHLGNRDEDWKASVGAFAAQSALHGFVSAATIFGFRDPGTDEARRLLEEFAEVAGQDNGDVTKQ